MLDLSISNVEYLNSLSPANRKNALSSGCFEPAKRGRVPAHLKQEHLERKEYCKALKKTIAKYTKEMEKIEKELAKAGKIKIPKIPAWYTKLLNENKKENLKNKKLKNVKTECPLVKKETQIREGAVK